MLLVTIDYAARKGESPLKNAIGIRSHSGSAISQVVNLYHPHRRPTGLIKMSGLAVCDVNQLH